MGYSFGPAHYDPAAIRAAMSSYTNHTTDSREKVFAIMLDTMSHASDEQSITAKRRLPMLVAELRKQKLMTGWMHDAFLTFCTEYEVICD